MMPERIGNIGKAQGVKESRRPAIKKVAKSILVNQRSFESEKHIESIQEILSFMT